MLLQRGAFAFTNELSTFAGYEMLKYVSFPVQVMAKSVKMLPNMMMGRIVTLLNRGFWDFLDRLYVLEVPFWCPMILSFSCYFSSWEVEVNGTRYSFFQYGQAIAALICVAIMHVSDEAAEVGFDSSWLKQVAVSSISCLHTLFWNSFPVWEID